MSDDLLDENENDIYGLLVPGLEIDWFHCGTCNTTRGPHAEAVLEEPKVTFGLTVPEIQAVLRANLNQLRHCYEQVLQRDPDLESVATLTFRIQADGLVKSPSATVEPTEQRFADCLSGKLARWRFPKPLEKGGESQTDVDVRVRFQLIKD